MHSGYFFHLDYWSDEQKGQHTFRYRKILKKEKNENKDSASIQKYPIYVTFNTEYISFHISQVVDNKSDSKATTSEVASKVVQHHEIINLPLTYSEDSRHSLTKSLSSLLKEGAIEIGSIYQWNEKIRNIKEDKYEDAFLSYSNLEQKVRFSDYKIKKYENVNLLLEKDILNYSKGGKMKINRAELLLDFLFDIYHSTVFQNSPYYKELIDAIESNELFKAIIEKWEYYYNRTKCLDNLERREKIPKALQQESVQQYLKSEKAYLNVITKEKSDVLFYNSGRWFFSSEKELKALLFNDNPSNSFWNVLCQKIRFNKITITYILLGIFILSCSFIFNQNFNLIYPFILSLFIILIGFVNHLDKPLSLKKMLTPFTSQKKQTFESREDIHKWHKTEITKIENKEAYEKSKKNIDDIDFSIHANTNNFLLQRYNLIHAFRLTLPSQYRLAIEVFGMLFLMLYLLSIVSLFLIRYFSLLSFSAGLSLEFVIYLTAAIGIFFSVLLGLFFLIYRVQQLGNEKIRFNLILTILFIPYLFYGIYTYHLYLDYNIYPIVLIISIFCWTLLMIKVFINNNVFSCTKKQYIGTFFMIIVLVFIILAIFLNPTYSKFTSLSQFCFSLFYIFIVCLFIPTIIQTNLEKLKVAFLFGVFIMICAYNLSHSTFLSVVMPVLFLASYILIIKKRKFENVHRFKIDVLLPRMQMSIISAWVILVSTEELWKANLRMDTNILLIIVAFMLFIALFFLMNVIKNKTVHIYWGQLLVRSITIIAFGFFFSMAYGVVSMSILGKSMILNSGVLEDWYSDYNPHKDTIESHIDKLKIYTSELENMPSLSLVVDNKVNRVNNLNINEREIYILGIKQFSKKHLKQINDCKVYAEKIVQYLKYTKENSGYCICVEDTHHPDQSFSEFIEISNIDKIGSRLDSISRRIERNCTKDINFIKHSQAYYLSSLIEDSYTIDSIRNQTILFHDTIIFRLEEFASYLETSKNKEWMLYDKFKEKPQDGSIKKSKFYILERDILADIGLVEPIPDEEYRCSNRKRRIIIYPHILLLYTVIALFIGVFLQIVIQDKSVTQPLE